MKKRFIAFFFSVVFVFSIFPLSIFATSEDAGSSNFVSNDLDETTIEYDFNYVFLNPDLLKENKPNKSSKSLPSVINIVEVLNNGSVELFVYISNVAQKSILTNEFYITLSFNDGSSQVNNFNKYKLEKIASEYYSKDTSTVTDASIIKFKVQGLEFSTGSLQREYSISELDFKLSTQQKINIPVNTVYTFTTGADGIVNVSTVTSNSIDVKANHSYYRVQGDTEGLFNDIQTVYFAIDNKYLNQFEMKDIKVSWQEYKTQPILMVDDYQVYKDFHNILFENVPSDFNYSFGSNMDAGELLCPVDGLTFGGHYFTEFEYGFNIDKFPSNFYAGEVASLNAILESLFYSEYYHNFVSDNAFDKVLNKLYYVFYTENFNDYSLKGENVLNHLNTNNWNPQMFKSISNIKTATYEIGSTDSIYKYDLKSSYFSYLFNWFEYKTKQDGAVDFYRFEMFDEKDASLDASALAEKYLIHSTDKDVFKSFVDSSLANDKTVFVLRYEVTETEIHDVSLFNDNKIIDYKIDIFNKLFPNAAAYECAAALCETTIIRDFDFIHIGFNDVHGNYVVFPVGYTPSDFSPDIGILVKPNYPDTEVESDVAFGNGITEVLLSFTLILMIVAVIIAIIIALPILLFKRNRKDKK